MPLPRPRYDIELADGRELVAEIIHGDQLRGELEGPRHGLSLKETPMHGVTLWCWASLVRTKQYEGNFARFKADVMVLDQVKDPEADDPNGVGDEDPTTPGQLTGSP